MIPDRGLIDFFHILGGGKFTGNPLEDYFSMW